MAKKINIDVNLRDEEAKKKLKDIQNGKYKVDMDVNVDGINQTTQGMNRLKASASNTNTTFGKLRNTISDTFSTGKLAMTGYLAVLRSINLASKNAKQSIEELDKSVTDLSVATNMSRKVTYDLLGQYNNMAKQLSSTTTQISSAADDYLRAGKSMSEANKLIQDSIMLSKLGQIDSGAATEDLLATMNGFNMSVEEVNKALDSMVAIDMAAATSSGDIATALKYCASSADVAGVSFDKLAAMIGTVQDKTQQSAETVGTFMNTLLSRYRNVKIGQFVDDDGQDLSDVETILDSVGIKLRETNQEFRDFETVIDEVAKSWNNYSGVQQAAIAKAFSGTRQQNRFIALMEGYNKTLELTEIAANSAGTAVEKFNNSYQNSLEAKQNTLQATFESMIMNSDMGNVYGDILDATTALVKFVDETNLLKGALTGLATFGGIKAFMTIKTGAMEAYVELNKFKNAMDIVKSTNISTAQFDKLLLLSEGLSKSQMKQVLSTNSLTMAQKKQLLMVSGLSEEESVAALQAWKMTAANNGLTASTTSASNAFKGLTMMIKANPFMIAVTAITIGVAVWQKYKQSIEEARQSAVDAANTYSETADSINDYVERYQELHTALLKAKGNEEETASVKSQLLDLQKELNEQFGDEYGKLNLVTDAYKDQTDAIKNYNKAAAENLLNDPNNRKEFETAESKMTTDRTYNLSDYGLIGGTEQNEALKEIAKQFRDRGIQLVDELGDGKYSQFSIQIKGVDAQQAYDTINDFETAVRQKAKELGDEHLFDSILDISGNARKEAENIIDEWGEIYHKGLMAKIAADDVLSEQMNKATSAVQEYNEAVLNSDNPYEDENVKSTYNNLQKIKAEISDDETWKQYRSIIDNTFDEADTKAYSFYGAIEQNKNGIGDLVDSLKGIAVTDIQSMLDDGDNNDVFDKLVNGAKEFGLSAEDVISLLKQIGVAIDETNESANNLSNNVSFTDTISQVQALADGLDQLDAIYADVCDKESFDWSSILNNKDFEATFGNMTNVTEEYKNAYNDFIQTVSNNPSNLSACQSAFDNLASAYIYNSDALKNVTEETKSSTIAMLEQMGVANADEIVTAQLAQNLLAAKAATIDFSTATNEDINSLVAYANQLGLTSAEVANLCLEQIDVSNNPIQTQASLANLQSLITMAGVTGEKLTHLLRIINAINNVASLAASGKATKSQITAAERLVNHLKDEMDEVSTANVKPQVNYTGGSKTQKAIEDAAKAAKDTAKTVKEAFSKSFDFIQNGIKRWETAINSLERVATNAYNKLSKRQKAYTDEIKGTQFGIELLQKDYEYYMASANAIGLDADTVSKIQGGSSEIAVVTDETLSEKISQYDDFYQKAQDCLEQIEELKIKLVELKLQKIQIEIDYKGDKLDRLETKLDNIKAKGERAETAGFVVKASNYLSQSKNIIKQIANLKEQNALVEQQKKLVDKNSESWHEYQSTIDSNNASIQSLTKTMIENANAASQVAATNASNKVDKYDTQDELTDAKISNASSYSGKNGLVNKKISNINKRKSAYDKAVASSQKDVSASQSKIKKLKNKSTKTKNKATKTANKKYNKILKQVKKVVKTGKEISRTLLDNVFKTGNSDLYNYCVQYNANVQALADNKEIADLYAETSVQDKADLALEKSSNIETYYNNRVAQFDQRAQEINDSIETMEANGYKKTKGYYDALIQLETKNNAYLVEEKQKLQDSLNEALSTGTIEANSEEYYELAQKIDNVTNSINESTLALAQFNSEMKQLQWDYFDSLEDKLKTITTEYDFLINELSRDDLREDDGKGKLTDKGRAVMGLHAANYIAYINQMRDYESEIKKIDEDLANDPYNDTYIQHKQDLLDKYREVTSAAQDEKYAVIDLAKEGYEGLENTIDDLISEYLELLDTMKDAYDYQRKISDYTKNIANIRKQLAAYANDTSEEARSKIQGLTVSLQDAEQDLADAQYDKFISDTKKMLNDFQDDFAKGIQDIVDDLDKNFEELLGDLEADSTIKQTILEKIGEMNYVTTEAFTNMFTGEGGIISGTDGIVTLLKSIDANIRNYYGQKTAETLEKAKEQEALRQQQEQAKTNMSSSATNSKNEAANYKNQMETYETAKTKFQKDVNFYTGSYNGTQKSVQNLQNEIAKLEAERDKQVKGKKGSKKKSILANYNAMINQLKDRLTTEQNMLQQTAQELNKAKADYDNADNGYNSSNAAYQTALQKEKAFNYLAEHLDATTLSVDQLASDVNKALFKKYSGLILDNNELTELANILGVDGNGLYSKLKSIGIPGFKKGSAHIPNDMLAVLDEDDNTELHFDADKGVLRKVGEGDKIFTNEMAENLWKLSQANPELLMTANRFTPVNTPNFANKTVASNQSVVINELTLPNVTNYEEFRSDLIKDAKFEKAVQSMTIDRIAGKSTSMSKFKFV